ncbi:hypothetical protein WA171_000239, partial [Blastocystis sp. BT1]
MASWESTLSGIRILENGIQTKLQVFSSFIRDIDHSNSDIEAQADRGDDIKQTINNLLKNYANALEELQRLGDASGNSTYKSIVERQRSVLRDFKKDFIRMDNNLQMKLDRVRLLYPGSIHEMTPDETEMQALLKERGAAHNSVIMADEYLNQASETHSQLINQRKRLEISSGRMTGMITRFPLVNNLMQKVKDKKNRDNIIVASFIAFCICFCIW